MNAAVLAGPKLNIWPQNVKSPASRQAGVHPRKTERTASAGRSDATPRRARRPMKQTTLKEAWAERPKQQVKNGDPRKPQRAAVRSGRTRQPRRRQEQDTAPKEDYAEDSDEEEANEDNRAEEEEHVSAHGRRSHGGWSPRSSAMEPEDQEEPEPPEEMQAEEPWQEPVEMQRAPASRQEDPRTRVEKRRTRSSNGEAAAYLKKTRPAAAKEAPAARRQPPVRRFGKRLARSDDGREEPLDKRARAGQDPSDTEDPPATEADDARRSTKRQERSEDEEEGPEEKRPRAAEDPDRDDEDGAYDTPDEGGSDYPDAHPHGAAVCGLSRVSPGRHQLPIYQGKLGGRKAYLLIDSGANRNFVAKEFLEANLMDYQETGETYRVAGGTAKKIYGVKKRLPIKLEEQNYVLDCQVVKEPTYDAILGIPWLRQHGAQINWSTLALRLAGGACCAMLVVRLHGCTGRIRMYCKMLPTHVARSTGLEWHGCVL